VVLPQAQDKTGVHILELLRLATAPARLTGGPEENRCPEPSVLHSSKLVLNFNDLEAIHRSFTCLVDCS